MANIYKEMMDDPFLDTQEVSKIIRVTPSTLCVWRCHGEGPDWVKMGRLVYYKTSAIRTFIEANSVTINTKTEENKYG